MPTGPAVDAVPAICVSGTVGMCGGTTAAAVGTVTAGVTVSVTMAFAAPALP